MLFLLYNYILHNTQNIYISYKNKLKLILSYIICTCLEKYLRNGEGEFDLVIDGISFQQVHYFKYLEANINNRNCMQNKIKLRLKSFKVKDIVKKIKINSILHVFLT